MPQRVRKIPVRTCVVCRQPAGKKELTRIVRTPEGVVEFDPGGKRSGRGAYVCSKPECRSSPAAMRQIGRALKTATDALLSELPGYSGDEA